VTEELYPPIELIKAVGSGGINNFKEIGEEFLRYFVELAGLKPQEKVLEIGCGAGRMALPLIPYLKDGGSYYGFDIEPAGVTWCQENITPKYHNFRFHRADVYNLQYNPAGKIRAAEYRFPYADAGFDFVFLASVFTHMLPEDMENYFSEVARVLKKGGRCLSSYFLLNAESLAALETKKLRFDFKDVGGGVYRVADPLVPEAAVAYDQGYIRGLYEKNGLRVVEPVYYGRWPKREQFLSGQDIIVAVRQA
jgi:ubiquinone/menaquinone biosynthesis C-methylase UbiE